MSFPHIFRSVLVASLACLPLSANTAASQTVAIENEDGEFGFGLMFAHRGTCYVALPAHVAGDSFFLTLRSEAPVASGSATVIRPFWEGIDLALAVARGGIEPRCIETAEVFDAPASARRASRALLERLTPAGEISRTPISVEDREYLTFTGIVASGETGIGEGTSGAFAFADGAPIGMAIRSDGEDRAEFMRIEEIAMNVNRYLGEHGTVFQTSPEPAAAAPRAEGGLTLALERASLAPVNPAFPAEAVLGDGVYVFEAVGRPELVFRIGSEGAVGLARVMMTAPTDAGYGFPRDVKVEFTPFPDARRWFDFGTFRMAPDGILDTGPVQPRSALFLRLTVQNIWGESPVAIGTVAAFGG